MSIMTLTQDLKVPLTKWKSGTTPAQLIMSYGATSRLSTESNNQNEFDADR